MTALSCVSLTSVSQTSASQTSASQTEDPLYTPVPRAVLGENAS